MANDINTVAISGRVVRDAELKHTNGGMAICAFSLASNYSVKKGDSWQEEVSFFDCVMFGRRAEALAQHLKKGKQLMLGCEVRQDRWTNNEGQNRSKVKFLVEDLVFGSNGGTGDSPRSKPSSSEYNPEASFSDSVDDGDFDDDLPF